LRVSQNNLKQIGLAFHNYHDEHGHFPPAAIRSKDGRPLLSWRVAILPYLEKNDLYKQFDLDEPWDSDHNARLLPLMPSVYQSPGRSDGFATRYEGIVGAKTPFDPAHPNGTTLGQILDGTSNTVLVVEAARPVPWTKPEDISFDYEAVSKDPGKLLRPGVSPLGGAFDMAFNALFVDGSVRLLFKTMTPRVLLALVTADGGEVIASDAQRADGLGAGSELKDLQADVKAKRDALAAAEERLRSVQRLLGQGYPNQQGQQGNQQHRGSPQPQFGWPQGGQKGQSAQDQPSQPQRQGQTQQSGAKPGQSQGEPQQGQGGQPQNPQGNKPNSGQGIQGQAEQSKGPHRIAPGDVLQIEVLEALPARPLAGLRRVRNDGTISLGYYGDLEVAGLTRKEVKENLVRHMQKYIADDALGLEVEDEDGKPIRVPPADTDRVWVDDDPFGELQAGQSGRREPGSGAEQDRRIRALERKLDQILQQLPPQRADQQRGRDARKSIERPR
jgi:hypothetical protein